MTRDDHPLDTQTAAPPTVPPRRLIVEAAMADDDDYVSKLQAQLAALRDQCDATLAAHHASRERLRAIERRDPV